MRDAALSSKKLAAVSADGERLYWRLMLVADDFGRFDASPVVILAKCFPLQVKSISVRLVKKWRDEILSAGLITLHPLDTDEIGEITKWSQRVRLPRSKFPLPHDPENDRQMTVIRPSFDRPSDSTDTNGPPPRARRLRESSSSSDPGDQTTPSPLPSPVPPFSITDCPACVRVLTYLNDRTARSYTAPGDVGLMLHDRHEQYGEPACREVIDLKVADCERNSEGWKYIGPNVLFKAKNFDTFINQGKRPAEPKDRRCVRCRVASPQPGSELCFSCLYPRTPAAAIPETPRTDA